MARYIDADKFIERLKASPAFPNMGMDGYFLLDVVENLLKKFPTADVAPKSEVERLEHLRAELSKEIETLKDNNEHLAVMLMEATSEVVESILYLIDDKIRFEVEVYNGFHSLKNCKTICQERVNALNDLKLIINHQFRAELKKKYTEGKEWS